MGLAYGQSNVHYHPPELASANPLAWFSETRRNGTETTPELSSQLSDYPKLDLVTLGLTTTLSVAFASTLALPQFISSCSRSLLPSASIRHDSRSSLRCIFWIEAGSVRVEQCECTANSWRLVTRGFGSTSTQQRYFGPTRCKDTGDSLVSPLLTLHALETSRRFTAEEHWSCLLGVAPGSLCVPGRVISPRGRSSAYRLSQCALPSPPSMCASGSYFCLHAGPAPSLPERMVEVGSTPSPERTAQAAVRDLSSRRRLLIALGHVLLERLWKEMGTRIVKDGQTDEPISKSLQTAQQLTPRPRQIWERRGSDVIPTGLIETPSTLRTPTS
ncbi:hypothetical protein NMY22_g5653 [Coprinellus aureogranulatus]|nr:hypothetical protein NMY22_g5653 [Coprinellus aureogranulatus]